MNFYTARDAGFVSSIKRCVESWFTAFARLPADFGIVR